MILATAHPEEARRLMRSGELSGVTSGLSLGYLQANLAILPAEAAGEFRDFCLANPRPLSPIDVTEPDDPTPRGVAPGGRPAYRPAPLRVYPGERDKPWEAERGGSGERLWSALDSGGLAILNVLPISCSQLRTRVLKDDLAGLGRVAQRDAPRFVR